MLTGGIGRELYTSPFIWIPTNLCSIKDGKCYDRFEVTHIKIENKQITELKIVNASSGVECFKWKQEAAKIEPIEDDKLTEAEVNELYSYMQRKGLTDEKITTTLQKNYGVNTLNELTKSQATMIKINLMKNKGEK